MENNQKMVRRPFTQHEKNVIILWGIFFYPIALIYWIWVSCQREFVTPEEFNKLKANEKALEELKTQELEKQAEFQRLQRIEQEQINALKEEQEKQRLKELKIQLEMEKIMSSQEFIHAEAKRRLEAQGYRIM